MVNQPKQDQPDFDFDNLASDEDEDDDFKKAEN